MTISPLLPLHIAEYIALNAGEVACIVIPALAVGALIRSALLTIEALIGARHADPR